MSVARAFRVIEHLARSGPTSLRALARELDIPVGSAHRLLRVLEHESVVEKTTSDKWILGYRLLNLAGLQLSRLDLPSVNRPALRQLADTTGQTAFLAVRSGDDVVYLDKVETEVQVQLHVELGARRPLHSTALGKVILAFESALIREEFLRSTHLPALTDHTITDAAALREQLAMVGQQGYATDNDEAVVGVSCLAAPLLDHTGQVTGAISIAGTDHRIGTHAPELIDAVLRAGARTSQLLGYSDASPPARSAA